jgi:PleD family two-component response regulator
MPGTDIGSAQRIADRIRQVFAMTTLESVEGETFSATLSASIVEWSEGIRTSTDLLQKASRALLHAKEAGRNRVERGGLVLREAG